jgi:hypothetical protein
MRAPKRFREGGKKYNFSFMHFNDTRQRASQPESSGNMKSGTHQGRFDVFKLNGNCERLLAENTRLGMEQPRTREFVHGEKIRGMIF